MRKVLESGPSIGETQEKGSMEITGRGFGDGIEWPALNIKDCGTKLVAVLENMLTSFWA